MVLTRAVFWCVKVKDFLPRTAGGSSGGKSQVVKLRVAGEKVEMMHL